MSQAGYGPGRMSTKYARKTLFFMKVNVNI